MQNTTGSVPDVASRGRNCDAPLRLAGIPDEVTSVSGLSAAREYLVDQLVITARYLANEHIFRKVPGLPFCQVCQISGLNGHPIQHLPSCSVGEVLRAIEELGHRAEICRVELDPTVYEPTVQG